MAEEGGITARLFERNCQELLQEIFLYLDPESLHTARQVCQGWNDFIRESVWGSQRGHRALERKLHNNWLSSESRVFTADYLETNEWHPYHTAVAIDNKYLVEGLDEDAMVIDIATKELVTHLPHKPFTHLGLDETTENKTGVWFVMITKSWIITQRKESAILWSKETFQQVLILDLPIEESSELLSMETDGGELYLAHSPPFIFNHGEGTWNSPRTSLYKLNNDSDEFSLEMIFDRKRGNSSKFGNNKDRPVLVTWKDTEIHEQVAFFIDQIDGNGTEREVSTDYREDLDYSFLSPNLVVLSGVVSHVDHDENGEEENRHKLILEVWNVERSPLPLYSIDLDQDLIDIDSGLILLQDNLIRVSMRMPGKIFVLDATTIEDRESVKNSRREIEIPDVIMSGQVFDNDARDDDLILFNKFLGVWKYRQTITYHNFWR